MVVYRSASEFRLTIISSNTSLPWPPRSPPSPPPPRESASSYPPAHCPSRPATSHSPLASAPEGGESGGRRRRPRSWRPSRSPVGDKLPDATLSYFDPADGELKTVTFVELTSGKKAVLFAVPGAFTPTCSQKHLPGFVEKAGELRANGVDTIACMRVGERRVRHAGLEAEPGPRRRQRAAALRRQPGAHPRARRRDGPLRQAHGLRRSRHCVLLADDGDVKVLNLQEGGAFTTRHQQRRRVAQGLGLRLNANKIH
ncbi:hypothetical protein ABZP36_024096 [Zizania latifolia]